MSAEGRRRELQKKMILMFAAWFDFLILSNLSIHVNYGRRGDLMVMVVVSGLGGCA